MRDMYGKKVVIVGAARQGLALARFLAMHGARVTLNDRKSLEELQTAQAVLESLEDTAYPIKWVGGGHPSSLLEDTELVCLSGGVPIDLPLVIEAHRHGIPLSNDSQIFMEAVPCKVVGITGSAGKTTTTSLVGAIGEVALQITPPGGGYRKIWVGGNIGSPLISVVDEMQPDDLAVLELSSFQLELMDCSPNIGVVLNLSPNHLDRHGTMEAYISAKRRIIQFQTQDDVAILGRDDPTTWSLAGKAPGKVVSFGLSSLADDQHGTFVHHDKIYQRFENAIEVPLLSLSSVHLRGEHNLLCVLAACAIAAVSGLPREAVSLGVDRFKAVRHRLEFIRSWGGADWYNDSIATAPERAMAAIRSFSEPLVLLAGGRDKNLPWDEFVALVRQRVDHLILFGEASDLILRSLALNGSEEIRVVRCAGLFEAVQKAAEVIKPGYVVLLSPGGTSFDEFNDFEERGECFARWVNELE